MKFHQTRKPLLGLLALTAGLSVFVLIHPIQEPDASHVRVVTSELNPRFTESNGAPAIRSNPTSPRLDLTPAARDPFVVASPPPTTPQASEPPPPLPVPTPPSPQAPSIDARFLGRMNTPEGKSLVYLAIGGNERLVSEGETLDSGYVVRRIAADGVTLTYPGTSTDVVIPITEAAR